ncbi:hypothetical protein Verru16b_03019 [Lacunisphaera limnophila]|uniref:Uncharacterized protein n=1 Tax=Lacunisphaera limnophila TaxID=1838286 RepID=A0A1D8AYG6_9BACT|nr:hypothetical protein [Lacunisphaera limnophila]AOS45928.1 hypothetical protein Verru16b_03019 [Lacunisphaera limnophila]
MAAKIKWNDDRVTEAMRAVLLLSRDQLARGETTGLVRAALAEFRADPAGYKANKAAWPDARETGPLTQPAAVAAYRALQAAVERQREKMTRAKRQFNSLTELDNALIATLERTGA